ncbi:MAG: hypothetical protein FWC98_01640 [Bacteroidales bacterium]|nr:hypothetical protein [Bacteroidales bacterium]
MKHITKILSLACLFVLAALLGCKKDESEMVRLNPTSEWTVPILQNFLVGEIDATNIRTGTVEVRYSATGNIGFEGVQITYTLIAEREGVRTEVRSDNTVNQTVSFREINAAMMRLGNIEEGILVNVNFYIEARVGASVNADNAVHSNTVVVQVAWVEAQEIVPPLFFIGNALGDPEWDNSNYRFVFFRDDNESVDVMFTNFVRDDGIFKVIQGMEDLGTWNYLWGGANGIIEGRNEGGDIPIGSGYQILTVDMINLTYTIEPWDHPFAGQSEFNSIGIIGGFNEWGGDVEMTQTSYDPNIWYIDGLEIEADTYLKFRADGAWAVNWGGPDDTLDNDGETWFPWFRSELRNGGENIPVPAGRYFVKINVITGHYVFLLLED